MGVRVRAAREVDGGWRSIARGVNIVHPLCRATRLSVSYTVCNPLPLACHWACSAEEDGCVSGMLTLEITVAPIGWRFGAGETLRGHGVRALDK